jgi:hypothetical protein
VTLRREQVLEQIDALIAEYERAQNASPHDDLSGGLPEVELGAIRTRKPAREILEDLAEHMLLSADTSRAGVRELRDNASRSVRELAGAGMLPPTATEELIALLLAARPARRPNRPPPDRRLAGPGRCWERWSHPPECCLGH